LKQTIDNRLCMSALFPSALCIDPVDTRVFQVGWAAAAALDLVLLNSQWRLTCPTSKPNGDSGSHRMTFLVSMLLLFCSAFHKLWIILVRGFTRIRSQVEQSDIAEIQPFRRFHGCCVLRYKFPYAVEPHSTRTVLNSLPTQWHLYSKSSSAQAFFRPHNTASS
jgi:hypothetical protein